MMPAPDSPAIQTQFRAHIRNRYLIPHGSFVLVGVSGRTSSVTLLYLLQSLATEWSLQLHIGHVAADPTAKHGPDAAYVRTLARDLRLPLTVLTSPHPPETIQTVPDALRGLQRDIGASLLATGETADDASAALLLSVLSPVPSSAPLPTDSLHISPLLPFSHAACHAYLTDRGLEPRQRSDALDLTSPKQRVRLLLLPLLQRHIEKHALEHLAAADEWQRADTEALDILTAAATEALGWQRSTDDIRWHFESMTHLPAAIRRRCLTRCARELLGKSLARSQSADLDACIIHLAPSTSTNLHGLNIRRADGMVVFTRSTLPEVRPD